MGLAISSPKIRFCPLFTVALLCIVSLLGLIRYCTLWSAMLCDSFGQMTLPHFLPGRLIQLLILERHVDSARKCLVFLVQYPALSIFKPGLLTINHRSSQLGNDSLRRTCMLLLSKKGQQKPRVYRDETLCLIPNGTEASETEGQHG